MVISRALSLLPALPSTKLSNPNNRLSSRFLSSPPTGAAAALACSPASRLLPALHKGAKPLSSSCSLRGSWALPSPAAHSTVGRLKSGRVKAVASEAGGERSAAASLKRIVELLQLIAIWYSINVVLNLQSKQVLKVFPYPITITTFQFVVGTVIVLFMWSTNLYKKPKVTTAQLLAILPLAVVHTLGNLFTNMSLGKVAVSFTHTIKAMEPFFSVLFSAMFLGEMPTLWVVSSLLPIVGGVALASITEASFNWAGFWSAMASNVSNQSRNVLSKKLMIKKEESLDNINLFSIITIMSLFLIAPVTLFVEGFKVTPTYLLSTGLDVKEIYIRSLITGLCFHAYQQVSYMILARVSPVTHSVGNCVKRVVVIVSSVMFFRTKVTTINSLGTGIALVGVFLYSRVKQIKPKAA